MHIWMHVSRMPHGCCTFVAHLLAGRNNICITIMLQVYVPAAHMPLASHMAAACTSWMRHAHDAYISHSSVIMTWQTVGWMPFKKRQFRTAMGLYNVMGCIFLAGTVMAFIAVQKRRRTVPWRHRACILLRVTWRSCLLREHFNFSILVITCQL